MNRVKRIKRELNKGIYKFPYSNEYVERGKDRYGDDYLKFKKIKNRIDKEEEETDFIKLFLLG
jgi:hypothetical protein